ncbi:hypothetical protein [Gelidibacter sp.]|uniref:hypothetical protein n=1 Tax=Gelidibacter sp. TaxID=2018083 RepID=UPI002C22DB3F|nr:hypothetical protein [Gelidibacter sp.]HUH28566.1 hypothetical protein [Gelidibacter sp.]
MEDRRWSDIHRLQGDDLHPIDGIPGKVANGPENSLLIPIITDRSYPQKKFESTSASV